MRNSPHITVTGALAALIVGLGIVGAAVPAFANSDGRGNGSSPDVSFSSGGAVRVLPGRAYRGAAFTAFYPGRYSAAQACAPTIVRHQNGNSDQVEYPAGC